MICQDSVIHSRFDFNNHQSEDVHVFLAPAFDALDTQFGRCAGGDRLRRFNEGHGPLGVVREQDVLLVVENRRDDVCVGDSRFYFIDRSAECVVGRHGELRTRHPRQHISQTRRIVIWF